MVNAEGEFMNDLSPSVRVVDLHAEEHGSRKHIRENIWNPKTLKLL